MWAAAYMPSFLHTYYCSQIKTPFYGIYIPLLRADKKQQKGVFMKRSDSGVQPSCTKLGVFMKKKKSMVGILALILVFAFTACDNGNDDTTSPFANTIWGGATNTVRFPGAGTWDGAVNPVINGRIITYNNNRVYIEVTHKNGNPVTGIGEATISGENLTVTITIGDDEPFEFTVPRSPGNGTETFHAIQGRWDPPGANANNSLIIVANQFARHCDDTNTTIAHTRTRFSILNELYGLNNELNALNITSHNRLALFQISFYEFYTDAHIGHIDGFWVDVDFSPQNELFVITDRVVQQTAQGYVIPLEGVYDRSWLFR